MTTAQLHGTAATGLPQRAHRRASTDWDEVKELLNESYCLLAPKKLVALLDQVRHDSRPAQQRRR